MNPKAPSLLTVPLPSLTSSHPAWGTEPHVSSQGPSDPGPEAHQQLSSSTQPCLPACPGCSPKPKAGAALESLSYPLLLGAGMSPGTRVSLGPHSVPTVTQCVLPYKAFSMNLAVYHFS